MSLILIENAAHSVKKLTVLRSFNLKRNECNFFNENAAHSVNYRIFDICKSRRNELSYG